MMPAAGTAGGVGSQSVRHDFRFVAFTRPPLVTWEGV